MQRPRAERTARLQQLLDEGALCPLVEDEAAEKTLEVFRAAGECLATYGERAIGPYIISMAQGADDVLSVLLLARWAGLADENGVVPLDIAPLLETVDDLERGPEIFAELLDDRVYQDHLETRRRRQMVMIGYSDSNKDSGIAAARWALHQAEERLVAVAESRELDLTLFHGRGGTISRGGGRTHTAALAAPRGAVRGRLRVTEQGEIINAKYGLRGIAIRTLEQAASSVAEATLHDGGDPPPPLWRQVMEDISAESRSAYRALVHEDDGFYAYFRQATPIDVIERMRIGSRPPARRQMQGIRDLRAIPWVFAWTQTRAILPGWYGVGQGLEAALERHGEAPLKEMFERWLFMRSMLDDLEMVLAKCDLGIARALRRAGRGAGTRLRRADRGGVSSHRGAGAAPQGHGRAACQRRDPQPHHPPAQPLRRPDEHAAGRPAAALARRRARGRGTVPGPAAVHQRDRPRHAEHRLSRARTRRARSGLLELEARQRLPVGIQQLQFLVDHAPATGCVQRPREALLELHRGRLARHPGGG